MTNAIIRNINPLNYAKIFFSLTGRYELFLEFLHQFLIYNKKTLKSVIVRKRTVIN